MDVQMKPAHDQVWAGRKHHKFMEIADAFAGWFCHNDPEGASEVVQKRRPSS